MKTKQLLSLLMIASMLCATAVQAKIWRVNSQSNYNNTTQWGENYGGSPSYPVFKQVNEAVNWSSVQANDSLYVEGSAIAYDDAVITKNLVIIGPGYFLTENPKVSNTTYDAKIGRISFNAGSENSQVIGMNVVNLGNSADGYVYVNVNGITIKRCRMERGVKFATLLNDVYILQNFFASGAANAIYTNGNSAFVEPNDIIFNNNICQTKLIWTNKNILECLNNVFDGPANALNLDFNTASFKNNILKSVNMTTNINGGTNNNVSYNTVSNNALFVGTTGNVWEPNMSNLLVTNGSTDGSYQLQASATNNVPGDDGAERGAFTVQPPSTIILYQVWERFL
ncbi:MAG: hypothetical protein R2783_01690 [Gelidibacter sp.]